MIPGLVFIFFTVLYGPKVVEAKSCGGGVACACGDNVTASTTPGDISSMTCSTGGDGLYIGANNIVIDGNGSTISQSGIPAGRGISNEGTPHSNITIRNLNITGGFIIGIYFSNVSSSTIQNVNTSLNQTNGVYLGSSASSTITNSTFTSNQIGIYSSYSASSTITNNSLISNGNTGLYIAGSNSSVISGNTFLYNFQDLHNSGTTNTYSNNRFLHNINSIMATFTESSRVKNIGDIVSSTISMFEINGGAPCSVSTTPSCSYVIASSPSEAMTISTTNNQAASSFVATKSGTYSLIFYVTDSNGNYTEREVVFLVGSTNAQVTRYYFRKIRATNGQPIGNGLDSQTLLFTPPAGTEQWYCNNWIQSSLDAIPDYPFSNLSGINSNTWYESAGAGSIGFQRYVNYGTTMDSSTPVPLSASYVWVNASSTNLNWTMDYLHDWYMLTFKLYSGSLVDWQTTLAKPSYADLTYSHTITPAVKSVSNASVVLLSATASSTVTGLASIALENDNTSATSTSIVLTGFDRPFLGTISTIDYTSTTTVAVSVPANATTSVSSVPLDITPSAGSIAVTVNTWNSLGDYSKEWVETGDTPAATSVHVVGNLKPNAYYSVKVDNGSVFSGIYQSDGSGNITFTYNGGYSTHTFDVTPDAVAPAISLNVPSSGATVSGSSVSLSAVATDSIGIIGVQFILDGITDIGSEVTSTSSPNTYMTTWDSTGITSYGSHTIYAVARDAAGNRATSTVTVNVNNVVPNVPLVPNTSAQTSISYSSSGSSVSPATLANLLVPSASTTAYLNSLKTNAAPGTAPTVVNITPSTFKRDLTIGSTGSDVKVLQIFLNAHGFTIASKGNGSSGHETTYFGSLTKIALAKFQRANKIAPAVGYFGPITRAKVSGMLGK